MKTFTYAMDPDDTLVRPESEALDSDTSLILAFAPSRLRDRAAALRALRAAHPRSVIAACSTSGAIIGTEVRDETLVVSVMRFDRSSVRVVSVLHGAAGSRAAGRALGDRLLGPGLQGVFVLSPGLGVNGGALAEGLGEVLGDSIPATGALAGDGTAFRRTWVHDGRHAASDDDERRILALGFYGPDLVFGHGRGLGWHALGAEHEITAAAGNLLIGLDGRPALEVYRTYLDEAGGPLTSAALHRPLALSGVNGDDVLRMVVGVDVEQQTLTFAGDMPRGARVRPMEGLPGDLVAGASRAAERAATRHPRPVGLRLVASCIGRRLVLGDRAHEELEATAAAELGGGPAAQGGPPTPSATCTQLGLYAYGELSPLPSGRTGFHNQTMTITRIGER